MTKKYINIANKFFLGYSTEWNIYILLGIVALKNLSLLRLQHFPYYVLKMYKIIESISGIRSLFYFSKIHPKGETLKPFESNNESRLDSASTPNEILNGFVLLSECKLHCQINLSVQTTSKSKNNGGRNFHFSVNCGYDFATKYMEMKPFWILTDFQLGIYYFVCAVKHSYLFIIPCVRIFPFVVENLHSPIHTWLNHKLQASCSLKDEWIWEKSSI